MCPFRFFVKAFSLHSLFIRAKRGACPVINNKILAIEMDAKKDVLVCHDIMDTIERDILEKLKVHIVCICGSNVVLPYSPEI